MARLVSRQSMILLTPSEVTIESVDNTVSRTALTIENSNTRGKILTLLITKVSIGGTNPTHVTVEILDTHDLTATLDSVNTIYRNTNIILDANPVQAIVNEQLNRPFVTKGTAGQLQIAITHTAGDGTTDYDYTVQIYGEEAF